MSDLTEKEQKHVRTALRFLRIQFGGWSPLAQGLRVQYDTVQKIAMGRRSATASIAVRLSRLVDVPFDDLVEGRYPSARACSHCGHPPIDFEDEDTFVGAEPKADAGT